MMQIKQITNYEKLREANALLQMAYQTLLSLKSGLEAKPGYSQNTLGADIDDITSSIQHLAKRIRITLDYIDLGDF